MTLSADSQSNSELFSQMLFPLADSRGEDSTRELPLEATYAQI